jgi:hypothetical protein
MIIKPSASLFVPNHRSLADSTRRRFMRTAALGAASVASAPLASAGLVDLKGQPFASTMDAHQNPAEFSAKLFRESLLAGLNLVPVVGGFLSYLGALFIPGVGQTTDEMWLKIIDSRISQALFRKVQRDLVGLTDAATLYRNAVSAGDRNEIRETSIAVNVSFTTLLPGFQISGEEVALIELFAIAATMHLCLLRDIAVKGNDLGLTNASIANYQQELQRRIAEYTRYADRHVAAAIEKARRDNPNTGVPRTRNQPLSAMLATKARYQISVLDLRDTWHAFDAQKFPTSTTVTLSREILSPIAGWWDLQSTAPSSIPDWKAPASTPWVIQARQRKQWRTSFLTGFSLFYENSNALNTGEQIGELFHLNLGRQYVKRVSGYFSAGVCRMSFRVNDGTTRTVGREPEENESSFSQEYADHCLSSLRSVGKGRTSGAAKDCVSGCIFGFQLIDKGPEPISVDALKKIGPKIAPRLLNWIAP